jgi:hypothetical protein
MGVRAIFETEGLARGFPATFSLVRILADVDAGMFSLAHAVFEEQEAAMRSAMDAEVRSRVQAELARVKADMETVMRVEQEKLMEASRQV